jgi:hypothetical protein
MHVVGGVMPDLSAVIAEGRDPNVRELFLVAERMWTEGDLERSAFAWGHLPPASDERAGALRAALIALCGV